MDDNDKQQALEMVQKDAFDLKKVPEHLQYDKDVVAAAVHRNCFVFRDALFEARDDDDFVLDLIKKGGETGYIIYQQASERVQNNIKIIQFLMGIKDHMYTCFPKSIINDKDIMKSIIKNNHYALRYATYQLQQDNEIRHMFLYYMENLSLHEYYVHDPWLHTLDQSLDQSLFQYSSPDLVMEFLQFKHKYMNEDQIKKYALKYPTVYPFLTEKIRSDIDIALYVIGSGMYCIGFYFQYIPEKMKENPEFYKRLAKQLDIRCIKYPLTSIEKEITSKIYTDDEFMLAIIKEHPEVFYLASEKLKIKICEDNDELLTKILNIENIWYIKDMMQYVPEKFRMDKKFLKFAVNVVNIFVLRWALIGEKRGFMSGKDFIEIAPNVQLRKRIPKDLNNKIFKYIYKNGLNVAAKDSPGLHATDDKNISKFGLHGDLECVITIPDDAEINFHSNDNFSANKMNIQFFEEKGFLRNE